MTDLGKIKPAHRQRGAFVYIRQSTPTQVEHNRESTERQYALADRAVSTRLTLVDHFRCQPEIIALSDALCDYGLAVHTPRASRSPTHCRLDRHGCRAAIRTFRRQSS
jgi:hypothetical protein